MTPDEVKSIFPKEMQCMDQPVDESKGYFWMARCYSTNLVTRCLSFNEVKFFRTAQVYFDSDGKLIGIEITGMSGGFLESNELRFPGELRFPSEVAPGHSAYPELYRRAMQGSATNKP
jgi:hypothetical protein